MKARFLILALMTGLALPSAARSDEVTRGLRDVTVIQDGEGHARVLFRLASPIDLENIAIQSANLVLECSGVTADRTLDLRLYAVSNDWTPGIGWDGWRNPGGDVHPQLYTDTELDLRSGQTRIRFNLLSLMKEIVERGEEAHGFLLTVRPTRGQGIRTEHLARLAGLENAVIRIQYRAVPPRPGGRV
jgi:hypothetical protein